MIIGFNSPRENNESKLDLPANALLVSDKNESITFRDALHNSIILGRTGEGKTTNAIEPILQKLIEEGGGGLILDIKNNMTSHAYELARTAGRVDDIVEMGTFPQAIKCNILDWFNPTEVYEFFKTLVEADYSGKTGNQDFHNKGIGMLADCCNLLRILEKHDPRYRANLKNIAALFNDYEAASKIWKYYEKFIYNPDDRIEKRFYNKIRSSHFHIFNEPFNEKLEIRESSKERSDQLAYCTDMARSALDAIMTTPGFVEHFATDDTTIMDMDELYHQGQLLIVRFGPESGITGDRIARIIINRFYKTVYAHGLSLPANQIRFVCMDEFHKLADFSSSRFSDNNFVSLAREFNCVFVAATQAISSLCIKNHDNLVDSFISNCHNKIIFSSDDPKTQQLVWRYDPNVHLVDLKPGTAFFCRYNASTRHHHQGLTTFQKAYESTRSITGDAKMEQFRAPENGIEEIFMDELADEALELCKKKLNEEKAARRALKAREIAERYHARNADYNNDSRLEKMIMDSEEEEMPQADFENERKINDPHHFSIKFPQLFDKTENLELEMPTGWARMVEGALTAFSKTGLKIQIHSFKIENGVLKCETTRDMGGRMRGARSIMNSLLAHTRNTCVICGKSVSVAPDASEESIFSLNSDDDMEVNILCQVCMRDFGLIGHDSNTPM